MTFVFQVLRIFPPSELIILLLHFFFFLFFKDGKKKKKKKKEQPYSIPSFMKSIDSQTNRW
jgi:hypothetical protein